MNQLGLKEVLEYIGVPYKYKEQKEDKDDD